MSPIEQGKSQPPGAGRETKPSPIPPSLRAQPLHSPGVSNGAGEIRGLRRHGRACPGHPRRPAAPPLPVLLAPVRQALGPRASRTTRFHEAFVAGLRPQSYPFRAAAGGRGGGTVDWIAHMGILASTKNFHGSTKRKPRGQRPRPGSGRTFQRRLSGVCSVESRSRFSRRVKCLSGENTKFTLRNRDILLYPRVNGASRGDGQKYRDGSSRDQFLVDDVVRERRWNSRNKAAQGLLEVGQIDTFWNG